jgi:hypothetical protein
MPSVTGPIPVTADSHPFNVSDNTDFEAYGYVEEEFFVSGKANVYELAGDKDLSVRVRTPQAPYTTRIVVRRPAAPEAFSGNVIVELLNPTTFVDLAVTWMESHTHFLRNGDIYVGITVKPITIKALKRFDPGRYAPLTMANPLPPDQTCPNATSPLPDTTPETENGLAWDIISQVGALLKSKTPQNPLIGFGVEKLYVSGVSQTGDYLITYHNVFHPVTTLEGGKSIYDGYLIIYPVYIFGKGGTTPLHQCADAIPADDPRARIQPGNVPVICIQTQTDFKAGLKVRREDSDAPGDRYRLYEIPGSAHVALYASSFLAAEEDMTAAGIPLMVRDCKEPIMSNFPAHYFLNGAFANLDRWVREGTPPPRADRIGVDENGETLLDEFGNALGGVRSPYLDVPTAAYYPSSTSDTPGFMAFLMGYMVPFDEQRLADLYGTKDNYMEKVIRATHSLVKERWITKMDGDQIKAEAANTAVPR